MTSQRKIESNRANARRGRSGRPTRAEDIETDRMTREIMARSSAKAAKSLARKLLEAVEAIKAGDSPMPAVPTAAKAADSMDSLIEKLIEFAGAKTLAEVQWHQVYNFCKHVKLDGSPRRTQLFLAWQQTQPLPTIPGLTANQQEER